MLTLNPMPTERLVGGGHCPECQWVGCLDGSSGNAHPTPKLAELRAARAAGAEPEVIQALQLAVEQHPNPPTSNPE